MSTKLKITRGRGMWDNMEVNGVEVASMIEVDILISKIHRDFETRVFYVSDEPSDEDILLLILVEEGHFIEYHEPVLTNTYIVFCKSTFEKYYPDIPKLLYVTLTP